MIRVISGTDVESINFELQRYEESYSIISYKLKLSTCSVQDYSYTTITLIIELAPKIEHSKTIKIEASLPGYAPKCKDCED